MIRDDAPTPETDAAILRTVNIYIPREDGTKRMVFELVEAAVCGNIERERDSLRAQLASKEEWLKHAIALREKAERELAEARRDSERLDKIQNFAPHKQWEYSVLAASVIATSVGHKTVRAAIDAALPAAPDAALDVSAERKP